MDSMDNLDTRCYYWSYVVRLSCRVPSTLDWMV